MFNALQINQNSIDSICLNKFTLQGSTKKNYKQFCVLQIVMYLYKKVSYYVDI